MQFRFFTKTDGEGNHVKLMVLIVDDENEEIYEFKIINNKLVKTSEVMQSLIMGSTNIDEVSKEEAKRLYPNINIMSTIRGYRNA